MPITNLPHGQKAGNALSQENYQWHEFAKVVGQVIAQGDNCMPDPVSGLYRKATTTHASGYGVLAAKPALASETHFQGLYGSYEYWYNADNTLTPYCWVGRSAATSGYLGKLDPATEWNLIQGVYLGMWGQIDGYTPPTNSNGTDPVVIRRLY
jgi:hypothetical protein